METSDKNIGNISRDCMLVCFAGTDTFEAVVPALAAGDKTLAFTLVFVFLSYHDLPCRCATAGLKCSS